MRRLTEAFAEEAGKFGLEVNTNKTEVMKIRTEDAGQVHI